MNEKFNYVVGRPWHPNNLHSSISAYSYGGQVFYGTMEDAENFRQYCNQSLKEPERHTNGYRIYKLVDLI